MVDDGVVWLMHWKVAAVWFCGMPVMAVAESRPVPGQISTAALQDFKQLDPARQRLVKVGLEEAARLKLNRYLYGSADPARGGFDCSGVVFYLLKKVGIDPPRTSSTLFDWVCKSGNLHLLAADAKSLDHPSFKALKPGDLLFWSGTYKAADGQTNKITHVQIYLGREQDGRAVMLGSTDGRSYRGTPRCGFGVFDFKLPGPNSKSKLVGYGKPPGLKVE